MSKITSKLQVTIPKAIADRYRIQPGDEVGWETLPQGLLMVPAQHPRARLTPEERVALFDEETARLRRSQRGKKRPRIKGRDWTREDLYDGRGLAR